MNTLYVGKRLIEILNQERLTKTDPKTFFEQEFWPIMFNSEDEKHLMQVGNSDFFQSSYKKAASQKSIPLPEYRKMKFQENLSETSHGKKSISGSIAVGFMASGPKETTFGQVTNLPFHLSSDELLYTWFGGALGIGFGGGFDFISTNEDIIQFIFSGWPYYRRLVEETPKLKGRQIETWNGIWLMEGLSHQSDLERAYDRISSRLGDYTSVSGSVIKLNRADWSRQIFALARSFGHQQQSLTLQGYSFGSTNKTLGHLLVQLPKVKYLSDLFDALIAQEPALHNTQIEEVYKTHYGLKIAAQTGQLGLKALTPKDLLKFLNPKGQNQNSVIKDFEKSKVNFLIYKSWIIAMLNNDETIEMANELAQALFQFNEIGKDRHLTENDRSKLIQSIWEDKNRRSIPRFIDVLSEIIASGIKDPEVFRRAKESIPREVTPDQFQLFISLLRFEYTYLQIEKSLIQ